MPPSVSDSGTTVTLRLAARTGGSDAALSVTTETDTPRLLSLRARGRADETGAGEDESPGAEQHEPFGLEVTDQRPVHAADEVGGDARAESGDAEPGANHDV